tara:strand:+ start:132 stop:509 length:378 start_codon:yes stop_codon:yes gene_type:complete
MTLENIVYASIAAVVGGIATVVTSMIRRKRSLTKIDEDGIKLNIEKIVNELNIKDVHFYILNENKDFSTENTIKFKFKSDASLLDYSSLSSFYQIKGRSGKIGVLILSEEVSGIKSYAKVLSRYF